MMVSFDRLNESVRFITIYDTNGKIKIQENNDVEVNYFDICSS